MTHGYKIKGKRKKLVPTDSVGPHKCHILAVDGALTSGFSNFVHTGGCADQYCGQVREEHIEQVVEMSCLSARGMGVPIVLVLEMDFHRNPEVVATLARVRRAWVAAFKKHAIGSRARIVYVYPQTWRSRMLHTTTGPDLINKTHVVAAEILGRPPIGRDEAVAVCIGKWATTAGEVARVLPRKYWGPSQ